MQAVENKPGTGIGGKMGMPVAGGGGRSAASAAETAEAYEMVGRLGACNAVVVFGRSRCCMCTVAQRLLFGLGVGPTVLDLDDHPAGDVIEAVLSQLVASGGPGAGLRQPVPAVFVGGKFLGGVEPLMACHINGTLVPLLKDAGALWL